MNKTQDEIKQEVESGKLKKVQICKYIDRKPDETNAYCDLIKDRKKYEIQLYQTAIKEYMSSKEKNLSRLIEYAVKLGVRDEVMMYVEVMV